MPSVFPGRRLVGLDAFRGFIMVLMALDHACYFVAKTHSHEFWGAELSHYPGAMEFLTRWVSHLCAPGFFLVMGIGVVMLVSSREKAGWSAGRITRFLMIRGALLILIQFFVENPAWLFGDLSVLPGTEVSRGGAIPGGGTDIEQYFGVLYALGGTLILCSLVYSCARQR